MLLAVGVQQADTEGMFRVLCRGQNEFNKFRCCGAVGLGGPGIVLFFEGWGVVGRE